MKKMRVPAIVMCNQWQVLPHGHEHFFDSSLLKMDQNLLK